MFKQFLDNATGYNGYLIVSLGMFLLFFIVVSILLLRMRREEINYMSDLPLDEDDQFPQPE